MRIAALALAASLGPSTAFAQLNMDIPPDWQRRDQNGQQIFTAPGRNEGVSINPAPALAARGSAADILDDVLSQYQQQYPDMRVSAKCAASPSLAVALFQRRGPTGLLGERLVVSTGLGSASIIVLWAPAEMFAAEDLKITGGNPTCPPAGRTGAAQLAPTSAPPTALPSQPALKGSPGASWVVRWTVFADPNPNEHAFTIAVPEGWRVQGGTRRVSAVDVRPWMDAISPDGGIELFFGHPELPPYTVPNQMLEMGGFREGMVYNNQSVVLRYQPGVTFASQWGAARIAQSCTGVSRQGAGALPRPSQQIGNAFAAVGIRLSASAGEAGFACTLRGAPGLGYVFAATTLVEAQGAAMWYVQTVVGFIASAQQASQAGVLLSHVAESYAIDSNWAARQGQTTLAVSRITSETQRAVSQSISEPFWNRGAAHDRSMQAFSQAIRGVHTYSDPVTGMQRELDTRPHQWTDPSGHLYWSNSSNPPSPGAREMTVVPPGQ
jgi:hypothetical protein